MGVTISGTFSGLDVSSIISTLIQADSIPITKLQTQSTALSALGTSLGNLSGALQTLAAPLENEFAQLDTVEANAQSLSGIINSSSSSGSSGALSSLGSVGRMASN